MHAVRNIRLCTKDCLCLYVCPTGATDTETGQVDASKCVDGCRICVDACPSHAISLVPEEYPPQQPKSERITDIMNILAASKVRQEQTARRIAKGAGTKAARLLAEAMRISNRVMAEDIYREAGYMLPQSRNTHELLESFLETETEEDFPAEAVKRLLELLPDNDMQ